MFCEYECYKIGGPWIAENPNCPIHGPNAPKEKSIDTVYIGFEVVYNGLDTWRNVERVFLNEYDAQAWVDSFTATEWEWRSYDKFGVE